MMPAHCLAVCNETTLPINCYKRSDGESQVMKHCLLEACIPLHGH